MKSVMRARMRSFVRPFPRAVVIGSVAVALVGLKLSGVRADEPAAPSAISPSRARAIDLNNQAVHAAQNGQFEAAASLLRQALELDPANAQLRQNLGGMLTDWAVQLAKPGHTDEAIALLEQALPYTPESPQTLLWLADLLYIARNDAAKAIELWKRAYDKAPDAQRAAITQRVSQAERDRAIERTFHERLTPHFRVRCEGAQPAPVMNEFERALEAEYDRLAAAVGSAPPRLTVIVYTTQQFQRVIGRRDWALGLYDGRLRLRLDDIGTDWGPSILAHELAHAFLAETYGPKLPTWIHEGFAQAQEPPAPLTDRQRALLSAIAARTSWVPLKWLDRRFEQPSNLEDVERAYLQARWVMQELIARRGMASVRAWLAQLSEGRPIDQAFDQSLAPLRWSRVDQGSFD